MTQEAPRLVERCGAYSMLLRVAFDQICDPTDWRGPIDALVPWDSANIYVQAVRYMTATVCECRQVKKGGEIYAHLTSVGYRMGPAGDH